METSLILVPFMHFMYKVTPPCSGNLCIKDTFTGPNVFAIKRLHSDLAHYASGHTNEAFTGPLVKFIDPATISYWRMVQSQFLIAQGVVWPHILGQKFQ